MPKPIPLIAVIVDPGDTLSAIAQRALGSAAKWPILAAVNRIANPDLILPGDLIVIGGPRPLPEFTRRRRYDGGTPWK